MCLILFSYKNHPDYPLVVLANRDEFYDRPAARAAFWVNDPSILAGRDLTAGGTWMGVSTQGKIAMLTNYRDLANIRTDAPSRGQLVTGFLRGREDARNYLLSIPENGVAYNGYNLVAGTVDSLFYQSNYSPGILEVPAGTHGLSNELLNTPWPKVEEGKKRLGNLLKRGASMEEMLDAMYDDSIFPDDRLPDTGVGLNRERMLSSMFIKSPEYGSRCTTLIRVDQAGKMEFLERTYNTRDFSFETIRFEVRLDAQVP